MEICLEVKGALGVHLQLMTKELGIIKEEGPHLSLKLFTLYGVPGESLYLFVPAKNILPILELNSFSINTKSDVPEFCSCANVAYFTYPGMLGQTHEFL